MRYLLLAGVLLVASGCGTYDAQPVREGYSGRMEAKDGHLYNVIEVWKHDPDCQCYLAKPEPTKATQEGG